MSILEKVARAMAGGEWHESAAEYWMAKAAAGLAVLIEPDDRTIEIMLSCLPRTDVYREIMREAFVITIQYYLDGNEQ